MNKTYINKCLKWLANELVEFYNTDLPKKLVTKMDTFYRCVDSDIDWSSLTKADVQYLGFLSWEEDDEAASKGIWFIPSWLYPIIPEGMTLYYPDGTSFVFNKEIASRESMYGCLQYGVILNKSSGD